MSAPEPLSTVVATGDRRASLVALRDFLAGCIESTEAKRDVAALVARLTDVMDRIDALPASVEGTAFDELARRRVAEGRVTATSARSRRG